MKILCVSPLFPSPQKPYYCIYLLQQLKAMQEAGNSVEVLIPDKNTEIGEIKREVFCDIPVFRVGYAEYGIEGVISRISNKFKTAAYKIASETAPDIIALNLCNLAQIQFFLNKRHFNTATAIHFHGLNVWRGCKEAYPFLSKIAEWEKKRLYKKADGIIGVSQKVCDIAKQHLEERKIFKVYNGVDTSVFYPEHREKEQNSPFRIACISNLIEIKGHKYLLKAVCEARKKTDAKIVLDIIGSGAQEERLKKLCDELKIGDIVNFCGEWQYPDIAEYLRKRCDFFIMPSFYEALGCVYLEAMASGVAALGIRSCGIDEVIENGVSGYLAEPQNAEQIENAILEALTNTEKFIKIAHAGYKNVTENYTWKHSAESLSKAYSIIADE